MAKPSTRGYKVVKQWLWKDLFHPDKFNESDPSYLLEPVLNFVYPLRTDHRRTKNAKEIIVPESTTMWLIHPWLSREISMLEHTGFISVVQNYLDSSEERRISFKKCQQQYAQERWQALTCKDKQFLHDKGWAQRFKSTGIGGVRGWDEVTTSAKAKGNINPPKSAWSCFQSYHFTQEGANRANLGVRWKALTPKAKVQFEEEAAADRTRFERERDAPLPIKLKCLHLHYAHFLSQQKCFPLQQEEHINVAGKRVHEELVSRYSMELLSNTPSVYYREIQIDELDLDELDDF